MTNPVSKEQVELAVREGIPFTLKMADGNAYPVTAREQVVVGKSHVAILDGRMNIHVLPFLTITAISYRGPKTKRSQREN